MTILPGDDPQIPSRCNYDTLSSNRHRNVIVMGMGVSDEVIIVVKRAAIDDAETYWRIKLHESARNAEAKDGTY
jgi:hypothetical protein